MQIISEIINNYIKNMRNFLLATMLLCILPLIGANAASDKKIRIQNTYGDAMGEIDTSHVAKQVEFMYDKAGRLSRKVTKSALHDGNNTLVLSNYGRNLYDENGHLYKYDSWNYAADSEGTYHFTVSKSDTISYEYNEKGQLAKESNVSYYYVYGYDDAGHMTTREKWVNSSSGLVKNTWETFSDFDSFGNPQSVTCEARASYNAFTGTFTYDAKGNKTSYVTYKTDETLKSAEYWDYDAQDHVTLYQKKAISSGAETDGTKTVYQWSADGSSVSYRTYTYSSSTGVWNFKAASKIEEEYSTLATDNAPVVKAEQSQTSNDVTMTITSGQGKQYKFYCDGLLQTTSGSLTYTVASLENGTHDFFVQDPETGIISDVVVLDVQRQLPSATNFKATKSSKDSNGYYQVTVTWTAPTDTDGLTLKEYNVKRVTSYGSSTLNDAAIDASATEATVSFGIDTEYDLFLETVYAEGKANTASIHVNAKDLEGRISNDSKKMTVLETYGDAMTAGGTLPTKKIVYYYGPQNRIDRVAHYGKSTDTDDYTITNYKTYKYDSNNLLVETSERNYGKYYYEELGFGDPINVTSYEYDDRNMLSKTVCDNKTETYEYDVDGNKIQWSYVETNTGSNDITQTITYSDFVAKDKPQSLVSDGSLSSYKYKYTYTYNSNNDVVTARKEKYSTYTGEYSPSELEKFIYDDEGNLVKDSVFTLKVSNGVETAKLKSITTREFVDSEHNRIKVFKQVWDDILGKLGNPKTYDIEQYAEIDGDKYAPTLTITPVSSETNTVNLNITVPNGNAMNAVNIFRNGIEIAHAVPYMGDDYNYSKSCLVYKDAKVRNDQYDYFVQYGRLNATLDSIEQANNISAIAEHTFDVSLPVATGLKELSRRSETQTVTDDETGESHQETYEYVTLGWDDAAGKDAYEFQGYNVMVTSMKIPENDDLIVESPWQYELDLRGRESVDVYIQAVYTFGRVNGDILTIKATDPSGIEEIENVNSDNESSSCYNILGQRITSRDIKGIVIKNGKKYINK